MKNKIIIDKKKIKTVCNLCNSHLKIKLIKNIVRFDKVYDVYLCERCSVGLTIPRPSKEYLEGLYSSGEYRAESGRRFNPILEHLIYCFRFQRRKRIKKCVKKGRLLDIGCGRGVFLDIMRKDGWDVTGLEFSKETASYASEAYDVKVITETSIDELPDRGFDVITLNHVLEHSLKPAELISECKRLLSSGGLLVIAVPNILSLQASAGKKVWFHLDLPLHISHFSEKGLSIILNKNSFRILKTRQFDLEYNPFGWLQTLLNLSGIRGNLLYNLLKSPELRRKELSNISKKDLIFTFVLLPLYFPISFALSALESFLLKRGGTIEVFAVKKGD